MQLAAYLCLAAAMLITLGAGLSCAWGLVSGRSGTEKWAEKAQMASVLLFGVASAILLRALVARDFSFQYVASYTDTFLPLFYAVTAFWAGQAGSFLFWALCVVVMAGIFAGTESYDKLSPTTKSWFWLFHGAVQVFFLLVLLGPTNPFISYDPAPMQGNGLNPLLRNPGMVFHPPLLFLGYAGYTVPACLALAAWLGGEHKAWLATARNWSLVSWAFLTAGIVLGAWWAYMELGWGGYWAWDPVENSSLIPWLAGTAFIHTAIIQERRNSLHRTNVIFLVLTLLLCFFATYVVRSGVIDSLHAFGDGGVGGPLLTFMIAMLAIGLIAPFTEKDPTARDLDDIFSRQGFLFLAAWIFLAVGAVILIGTMWPVISNIWSDNPVGLDAGFYNRVCLPLFTIISLFLMVCPWLSWKEGLRDKKMFFVVMATSVPAAGMLWGLGVRDPLPLIAATSGIVCLFGIAALFIKEKHMRKSRFMWGAYGVHIGLALMVIGVAFSGPYQREAEVVLVKGGAVELGEYKFTYVDSTEQNSKAMAVFEAVLKVEKDGKVIGELHPQRRMYANFQQAFSEVSVIPSLGNEIYSTVLGHDHTGKASFHFAVNPLVNWVWIGGTLMTLLPFAALGRRKKKA